MPGVNPALLNTIQVGINARFVRGLTNISPVYPRMVEVVPSTKRGEVYPFVNDFPVIEEWVGSRQAKQLKTATWQIDNKHFEGTLKVNKDQVSDLDTAWVYPYAERLGRAAALYPDKMMAALIEGGFTTTCYDGLNFFSATHTVGSSTASNLTTSALTATTYAAGRAAMGAYLNDQGMPLGIIPDLLVIPPGLEGTARSILNADFVSDGAGAGITNVWKGSADMLILPWLTDTNNWYLFATKQLLPPLIFQNRQDPVLVPRVNMNDDNLFWLNEYVWGVDFRAGAGYGAWQCAYGANV